MLDGSVIDDSLSLRASGRDVENTRHTNGVVRTQGGTSMKWILAALVLSSVACGCTNTSNVTGKSETAHIDQYTPPNPQPDPGYAFQPKIVLSGLLSGKDYRVCIQEVTS